MTIAFPFVRSSYKYLYVRIALFLLLINYHALAQFSQEENDFISKLTISASVPAGLLASRSVIIYQPSISRKDMEETQKFFQQTGIDAVSYFSNDYVFSGYDIVKAASQYFNARNVKFIILMEKTEKEYQFIFAEYIGTPELFDKNHAAWKQNGAALNPLLRDIYRACTSSQKKLNFLINDLPETDNRMRYFSGRHNETFSYEAKTFKTAIPKWGNEKDEQELEAYLKENFPLKYDMVDANADENALLTKGYRTILRFVHAKGATAKDVLGYDITESGNALATVTYVEGVSQVKTIPADKSVYKFYFRNIEYGNIFLGTKWDADVTWQDALRNHITGFKIDQKVTTP